MTLTQLSHRRSEQGFTLVELAIVMVIIGLLIGGILKGQELIANARISSTVSQIKGAQAAANTFRDKYDAFPGDIAAPQNRLPNCTAAPCNTAGTGGTIGNLRIESGSNVNTAPGGGTESGLAFVHLSAADLVSGITPNGGATFGGQFPSVRAGGGMWLSFATAAVPNTTLPAARHYFTLTGNPTGAVGAGTGSLNATTAAQIDRKMDNGLPQTGDVQIDSTGTNCQTGAGAAATYNEAAGGGSCTLYAPF